jgi:putative isomerase
VSQAAIELVRYDDLRPAVAGSLLNLLDCAAPSGCVFRTELPERVRELEPAKPVLAQLALTLVEAMDADGPGWALRNDVFPRLSRFIAYYEREYTGAHGLFLTHSSRASGFDSDVLTAGLPDKSVEGPDTNAFMVLEYGAMGELARRLGEPGVEEYTSKAEALRQRIESLLWYEGERGGFYTALRARSGAATLEARVSGPQPDGHLAPLESWVGLLPLYAGIPSPARARRLCERLLNPSAYWGPQGVRTAPADDVYFQQAPRVMLFDFKRGERGPVSNWSGPVWVLSNYYLAEGLRRYGFAAEARALARRTADLLSNALARQGALHECYNDAGVGLWPRRGTFISWNVLALTLLARDGLGCP